MLHANKRIEKLSISNWISTFLHWTIHNNCNIFHRYHFQKKYLQYLLKVKTLIPRKYNADQIVHGTITMQCFINLENSEILNLHPRVSCLTIVSWFHISISILNMLTFLLFGMIVPSWKWTYQFGWRGYKSLLVAIFSLKKSWLIAWAWISEMNTFSIKEKGQVKGLGYVKSRIGWKNGHSSPHEIGFKGWVRSKRAIFSVWKEKDMRSELEEWSSNG